LDAVKKHMTYGSLILRDAWRVENRRLWSRFQSKKEEVQEVCEQFRSKTGSEPVPANLREGLVNATDSIRQRFCCDNRIQEVFLFHGLADGSVSKLDSIFSSNFNEHFAGGNAGMVFGAGLYFAEDIGKADQYCVYVKAGSSSPDKTPQAIRRRLDIADDAFDEGVCYAILARVILGCPLSTGPLPPKDKGDARDGTVMDLDTEETPFGPFPVPYDRELKPIPDVDPSTPHHSLIAEVKEWTKKLCTRLAQKREG
jgi:hypothetical protein